MRLVQVARGTSADRCAAPADSRAVAVPLSRRPRVHSSYLNEILINEIRSLSKLTKEDFWSEDDSEVEELLSCHSLLSDTVFEE